VDALPAFRGQECPRHMNRYASHQGHGSCGYGSARLPNLIIQKRRGGRIGPPGRERRGRIWPGHRAPATLASYEPIDTVVALLNNYLILPQSLESAS